MYSSKYKMLPVMWLLNKGKKNALTLVTLISTTGTVHSHRSTILYSFITVKNKYKIVEQWLCSWYIKVQFFLYNGLWSKYWVKNSKYCSTCDFIWTISSQWFDQINLGWPIAYIIVWDKKLFECKNVIIFLPINLNLCFGFTKEPSYWNDSFKNPQHMFCFRSKKIMFIWRLDKWHSHRL